MKEYKKDNIVLKIISIIGIFVNSMLLISIFLYNKNLFTLIISLVGLIGVYYPFIKMRKADRILLDKEIIENNNDRLKDNIVNLKEEINSLERQKNNLLRDIDVDFDRENKTNDEIIDGLRLKNIELNNIISDLNKSHDVKIRDLKLEMEKLQTEHELQVDELENIYGDRVNLLENRIEAISLWTNEKRNDLKEEALFEYLSLIREEYSKKLRESDGEETEEGVVFTHVAGVRYDNPYGQSRQKLIRDYVKENYSSNKFDKEDYDYLSNKDIEEAYDYGDESKFFQYELEEINMIRLVKEPDNKYDKNAIAIIHDIMGHIGYIPRKHIDIVKKLMECGEDLRMKISLYGGRYKYYDRYEEKVKSNSIPYYFDLIVETRWGDWTVKGL